MLTTTQYNTSLKTKYTSAVTDHSDMINVTLNDKNVSTVILICISEHEGMHTPSHTHTNTHSDIQFIMSVMR